jgi:hypothetical protein
MPSPAEINTFLLEFKQEILKSGLTIADRTKNLEALIELGFTKADLKNTILNLTVADYSEGPIPNDKRSGEVWIFGKPTEGVLIYIKLQLLDYLPRDATERVKQPVCISFHKASSPLSFPYALSGRK